MLKRFYCFLLLTTSLISSSLLSGEADFITYDWLIHTAKTTAYTDHIPHFRRLFKALPTRGFLECGCGFSTKYFLDNCREVTSIEYMNPSTSDAWFRECLRLYKNHTNWVPVLYNADFKDDSFNKACAYQWSSRRDYALIDSTYLVTLDRDFKSRLYSAHLKGNDIDVAFVDPGVYIRGDMVKLLLANKVPVVVAHDTKTDVGPDVAEGLYGWFKVKTPADYEKIYIPFGQGTTFWIHKSLPNVIQSMRTYEQQIIKSKANGNTISFDDLTKFGDMP